MYCNHSKVFFFRQGYIHRMITYSNGRLLVCSSEPGLTYQGYATMYFYLYSTGVIVGIGKDLYLINLNLNAKTVRSSRERKKERKKVASLIGSLPRLVHT
jgi:hypothetical protein